MPYLSEVFIQFRICHGNVSRHILVKHKGEDGVHGVDGGIAHNEETGKEVDGSEVEDGTEHHLHGGDDKAAVDHKLAQRRWPLVAVGKKHTQ